MSDDVRKKLMLVVEKVFRDEYYNPSISSVVEDILAAGWRPPARVIETLAELEALPIGAAIRSRESGQIATRIDDPGFGASSIHYFSVSGDKSVWFIGGVAALLPATVLWESGDPR